ncbi:MAG TPA: diphthine synthase [Candidatus Nanoarchaeia archaeon]|nr:diphthine synthase [Candidatus Nanoarchaeia archaeon]
MLYLVGLGLAGERDLSLRGLDVARKAKKVYLENYTSPFLGKMRNLEKLTGKKIVLADRRMMEEDVELLLKEAKKKVVVVFVVGDVFCATTHADLVVTARKVRVKVKIIHNASVLTAVGDTGLSLYKFGKVASVPFPEKDWKVETPYDIIKENKDAHTLLLLDLRPEEKRFMAAAEALKLLLEIEKKRREGVIKEGRKVVVCCALGTERQRIVYGPIKDVVKKEIRIFPQVLIFPGALHFMEEEIMRVYEI